jgi:Xaa-Pro dipeptidase
VEHLPKGRVAFVGEPGAAVEERFPVELRNPASLIAALEHARTLKTPYEVECLAEANRRSAIGHKRVAEGFAQADLAELQLHLVFLAVTEQDDSDTPYKNIVARGENAATLHHVTYRRRTEGTAEASSLLLDAGAGFRGYGSDVTRTHVRGSGAAATHFRGLIAAFDAMQQQLCAAVRPGLPYEELHDQSHFAVAGVLREAGIVRASVEDAVVSGLTRAFYPHGLGHSLGLQTHDVGCALVKPKRENPFLRNTSTIAAGQVFTIEPGLYFIRSLLLPLYQGPAAQAVDWNVVEAMAPFGGIRIEDDLFVGEGGVRNLTREALG